MRNFWAAPTDLFATLDRYWFVGFPPAHFDPSRAWPSTQRLPCTL